MGAKRIAVLYRSSLLAQGLEATLREANNNNTEVHGLDLETPGALEKLRALAPYAVVLDPQELRDESLADFLGLIESCPLACVVSLRWGENVVDILRKERIEVAKARDVLAAIVGPHEQGPGE
jgi:hypothetical protein